MNPFTHIGHLIRHSATGPVRLPAPLSWRMLTRDPAAAVQRAILMEYLKTGSTASRLLTLGIALMFWPFRTFAQAVRLTRKVGGQVTHIRSRPAQFVQQLWLAWFHGISPYMYYHLGMASSSEVNRPMEWLQNGHAGLLSRVFREDKTLPEINDKLLFARIMHEHRVPIPPILAAFEAGQLCAGYNRAQVLHGMTRHKALFVKPVRSSGGKASMAIQRMPDGRWTSDFGDGSGASIQAPLSQEGRVDNVRTSEALLIMLGNSLGNGSFIVQPRLENHPDLPSLGGAGLASIRILTGLRKTEVTILRAVLSLPLAESITSQRGFKAAIDAQTGRLGQVFLSKGIDQQFSSSLGPKGPAVEGRQLPFWPAILDQVRRAHLALLGYMVLGWDVAVTPDGPVFLEANGNFDTVGLQKPGPRPLIDSAFLAVFSSWSKASSMKFNEFVDPVG